MVTCDLILTLNISNCAKTGKSPFSSKCLLWCNCNHCFSSIISQNV